MSNVSERAAAYFGFTNDPEAVVIKTGRRSVAVVLRRKRQSVLGLYKEWGDGQIASEFLWLDEEKRRQLANALGTD